MKKLGVAVALAAGTLLMAAPAFAQNQHRQGQGQAIVTVLPAHEGEQAVSVALQDVKVKINGKQSSVTSWTPLRGPDSRIELVLLIDSGASRSLGEEMGELRQFIQETPSNTKIAIAYMENGRAAFAGPLSANPAEVERGLHCSRSSCWTATAAVGTNARGARSRSTLNSRWSRAVAVVKAW